MGGCGVKGWCLGKVKGGITVFHLTKAGDPVGRERERNGGMVTSIR